MYDKNNSCKISIIVTCYNVEQYLPKCIDSIWAQIYKNIEVISVDEIGLAVMKLMDGNVYQPELLDYMKNNFSAEACSKKLEKALIDRM